MQGLTVNEIEWLLSTYLDVPDTEQFKYNAYTVNAADVVVVNLKFYPVI